MLIKTNPYHSLEEQNKENLTIISTIEIFLLKYNSTETKRAYYNDIIGFFNFLKVYYLKEIAIYKGDEITDQINKYLTLKSKKQKYRPDEVINAKSINRVIYSLSAFFNFLVGKYNYPFNPLMSFSKLNVAPKSNTESLNKSEVRIIIEYMERLKDNSLLDYRNYLIILTFCTLALRRNELANLKWEDINFHEKTITIFQKGRTYKTLPIPNRLFIELSIYKRINNHDKYIFTPTINNKTKNIDKPITTDLVFKIIQKEVSKIYPNKNITPHSFRKSFIEICLTEKIDPSSIINATGHRSLDSLRYYDGRNSLTHNAVNEILEII